jgi:hypothetical protein
VRLSAYDRIVLLIKIDAPVANLGADQVLVELFAAAL